MKGFFSDLWNGYADWAWDRNIMDSTPFVFHLFLFIGFVSLWAWGCHVSNTAYIFTVVFWVIIAFSVAALIVALFIHKVLKEFSFFISNVKRARNTRLRKKDKQS